MKARKTLIAGSVAIALGLTAGVTQAADEVVLKDGSRVLGTIKSSSGGVVVIDTAFAGTLTIPADKVSAVTTDEALVVKLKDGRVTKEQPIAMTAGEVVAEDEAGGAISYQINDIDVISPEPWQLGHGYDWQGVANVALQLERGNTKADKFNFLVDNTWLSLRDRISLILTGKIDETEGVKTADNWQALAKYDYFLDDPRYYVGVNASLSADEFTDLDLRTYIGPYFGVQWYDTPNFRFATEFGVVYVKEEYISGGSKEYPGANWTVDITSEYFGGGSRIYFNHSGVLSLEEASDLLTTTRTGIAFPLMGGLELGAEALFKYDGSVEADVKSLDEVYSLRLGYSW